MHQLRSLSVADYKSASYTGKAIKMGAGVQAFEAYSFADQNKLRVVGGTCPTVGLSGGYTQGGGHSMLSTLYGLGADQVLEWEVVLADGSHVRATPNAHKALYWALSGGGGGSYAVVLSMTVKAYQDTPVTGAMLTITQSSSADDFWDAVNTFHAAMPSWIDHGAATGYFLVDGSLSVIPATFPNLTSEEVNTILQPFVDQLDKLEVTYNLTVTSFDTYLKFFDNFFGPLPYGSYTSAQVQGGRLVPRSILASEKSNTALTSALREITSNKDFHIVGVGVDVSQANSVPNSVHPGWRKAITTLVIAANWDYQQSFPTNAANETLITTKYDPLLESITGSESGAYMNEGDFQQPDFQSQFFGSNYGKLKLIKKRYDPKDVFYTNVGVGSDDWKVADDGRLCRV